LCSFVQVEISMILESLQQKGRRGGEECFFR
jgi:hypothetical protein